jgi:hypothetical protein
MHPIHWRDLSLLAQLATFAIRQRPHGDQSAGQRLATRGVDAVSTAIRNPLHWRVLWYVASNMSHGNDAFDFGVMCLTFMCHFVVRLNVMIADCEMSSPIFFLIE